jgi:hypothetical protein
MIDTESITASLSAGPARVKQRFVLTARVGRMVFRGRRTLAVLLSVTVAYLLTFLWMLNDIIIHRDAGWSVFVVDTPLQTMLQPAPGSFLYQPVALLELQVAIWEFSPLNTLLGIGIATLVGLNIAFSVLAITQPKSCGISPGAGILASVPALLAGSTCCAPVILLVLGIQASGILLTAFVWLLPVSISLLVLTLVHLAGKVDSTAVS